MVARTAAENNCCKGEREWKVAFHIVGVYADNGDLHRQLFGIIYYLLMFGSSDSFVSGGL
jgi:hypothetical protein